VDLEQLVDERAVGEVALDEREVPEAVDLRGGLEALLGPRDGRGAGGTDLLDPLPSAETVHEDDPFVRSVRDAEGGRPPEVAVAAADDDAHRLLTP
jgi:hypothetical protein